MAKKSSDNDNSSNKSIITTFSIVGIGASAGGLAAFEEFFLGIPEDELPNMAFVLIQHLSPNYHSILTEIIKRKTSMQVYEVTDGMRVMPNCVYVIPPNKKMTYFNGNLFLHDFSSQIEKNMPINYFFQSLADDLQERSIGVILSGTGSDGTLGLRSIKAVGGVVFVQSRESAEFDGMPQSAIETGLADYILPPREIPNQIFAYNSRYSTLFEAENSKLGATEKNAFKKILFHLRSYTRHDFSDYKYNTLNRRITRRLLIHKIEKLEDYVRFLQNTPSEIEALFHDILIGVTSFFRDVDTFLYLENVIIPNLFQGKEDNDTIRLWSIGCSTGEEAYSLAILLYEYMEKNNRKNQVKIFASDIDNHAISFARTGAYSIGIETAISPERLAKYFKIEPQKGLYHIIPVIRDMLVFSEQNIIQDRPFSKIDLISCRNLLIYFNSDLQKTVIPTFHYSLNPGGYLLLGNSETIGDFGNLFNVVNQELKIYSRKKNSHIIREITKTSKIPKMDRTGENMKTPILSQNTMPKISLKEITVEKLLQESSFIGILIDDRGDILYLHGRAGKYLEPTQGETSVNNVLKMAREGLKQELRKWFYKMKVDKESSFKSQIKVRTNGEYTKINLIIKQIKFENTYIVERQLYLVIIDEIKQETKDEKLETTDNIELSTMQQYEELKRELQVKDEHLQNVVEELETSNEDLKTSNEKLQSVNEELQSTNEEMETSKEELQSINEELSTVNTELQTKVLDLTKINNDMSNLLSGRNLSLLVLDFKQNIIRFTPTLNKIINLISTDIGRPIAHMATNIVNYSRLAEDIHDVMDSLIPKTVTIKSTENKWYDMIIQPYRTLDNVIEGTIITFIDITKEKNTNDLLTISESKYRTLFETSNDGVMILDGNTGKILDVNPFMTKLLGYTREEFLDKDISSLKLLDEDHSMGKKSKDLKFFNHKFYGIITLVSASGKTVDVEFISNTYSIEEEKFVQCNVRPSIKIS